MRVSSSGLFETATEPTRSRAGSEPATALEDDDGHPDGLDRELPAAAGLLPEGEVVAATAGREASIDPAASPTKAADLRFSSCRFSSCIALLLIERSGRSAMVGP